MGSVIRKINMDLIDYYSDSMHLSSGTFVPFFLVLPFCIRTLMWQARALQPMDVDSSLVPLVISGLLILSWINLIRSH